MTEVSPDALVMCGFGEVGRALAKVLDDAGLGSTIDAALWHRLRAQRMAAAGGTAAELGGRHIARMAAPATSDSWLDGAGGHDTVLPSIVAFTTREVRCSSSPLLAARCAAAAASPWPSLVPISHGFRFTLLPTPLRERSPSCGSCSRNGPFLFTLYSSSHCGPPHASSGSKTCVLRPSDPPC